MSRLTVSVRLAPLATSPRFETRTPKVGGSAESATVVRIWSSVLGETRTLRASCSGPSQKPAIPRRGRMSRTNSNVRAHALCELTAGLRVARVHQLVGRAQVAPGDLADRALH